MISSMRALESFLGGSIEGVKRIGWFGISADPPSLAHRTVVDAVLGSGKVDRVVVFPTGNLPYKQFVARAWQRAEMTDLWKAAAAFGDEVQISRFDLIREQAIFWYDLWKTTTQMAPKIQQFLVVGSDQYEGIGKTWHRGNELLEDASFLVAPRKGFPLQSVSSKSILLNIPPIDGSSTEIRAGDLHLVDERVRAYILGQKLYS
jgi:nicotinate (nicotinamide) nucleotide adenylyltransferase